MKYLSLVFLSVLLISCSNTTNPDYNEEYEQIKSLPLKEAIALANKWRGKQKSITSYVNYKELIIKFPDGREMRKPLPNDEMYIAIAPYINFTHSCETHYISSCQGELKNKTLKLICKGNGKKIFDENMITLDNGFIELWLPREEIYDIIIEYQNKNANIQVNTKAKSKTCITTAKLE